MSFPSIELSIYMTGLMLLTRKDKSSGNGHGGDELQMLLPDARKPGALEGTAGSERHIPVVQFPWQNLVNRDTRPFKKFDDLASVAQGLWILDKDVLHVEGAQGAAGLATPAQEIGVLPDEHNRASVRWMARGPEFLKPGMTAPFTRGEGEPLVGVLRLGGGELRTAGFNSQQGQYILFDLEGETSARAVASVVEYRTQVPGNSVRLKATKFDGTEGETLELRPTLDPLQRDRRRIEIWLLNREWDAISKQLPSRPIPQDEPNPEYRFVHQLLHAAPAPAAEHDSFIARQLRRANGAGPNAFPCDDPVMRMLYFPGTGGQNARGGTCSPMVGVIGMLVEKMEGIGL